MFSIIRRSAPPTSATIPTFLFNEWDPIRLVAPLLRANQLSDSASSRRVEQDYGPVVDAKEGKDHYLFKADLPGLGENDVEISLTGNILTLSGKREWEALSEGERSHLTERSYGSFSRSFTLPEDADAEKIKAVMKDGVLSLYLPKRAESQPRRISISK
jgi:HSP20 family protein